MKKFNASDLSKKPSQVFEAAREGGAIIQHKDRQGKVVEEFIITDYSKVAKIAIEGVDEYLYCLNPELIKG